MAEYRWYNADVWLYMLGCWMFGLVWIALLSELARSEESSGIAIARGLFVLGLGLTLGATVVIVAAGNTTFPPSRSGLWAYSLACAIPITLVALVVARRAFNRQVIAAISVLPTIGLLAAAAAAFRPAGARLDGLAATAHEHHTLVVAAVVVSVAIATAAINLPQKAPRLSADLP